MWLNKFKEIKKKMTELKNLIYGLERVFEENDTNVRFFIGGSFALHSVYGILDRVPNDLDIVLVPAPDTNYEMSRILGLIQKLFPLNKLESNDRNYSTNIDASCINVNVNASVSLGNGLYTNTVNFLLSSKDMQNPYHSKIMWDCLKIVPLMNILKAKAIYNREKDNADFYKMVVKMGSKQI